MWLRTLNPAEQRERRLLRQWRASARQVKLQTWLVQLPLNKSLRSLEDCAAVTSVPTVSLLVRLKLAKPTKSETPSESERSATPLKPPSRPRCLRQRLATLTCRCRRRLAVKALTWLVRLLRLSRGVPRT